MKFKKKKTGKNKNYSISNKLRKELKSNDQFEFMLNNLSLEEIIGLKLELAAKSAGGMLYGLPIWFSLQNIVQDAVLKYAYSATGTKLEAGRFLGFNKDRFNKLIRKYKTDSYFEEKKDFTENI